MRIPKNPDLIKHAKSLRREMTPHERKLWYLFLRSYPVKIYKQRIIDNYIVDFYCSCAKLVIEIDGSQHYTDDGFFRDENRSYVFEQYGVSVIRFSNRDVDRNFDAVCCSIHHEIQSRLQ